MLETPEQPLGRPAPRPVRPAAVAAETGPPLQCCRSVETRRAS